MNRFWLSVSTVFLDLLAIACAFLPSIILKYCRVEPFHRGFYCDDESIAYPFKSSTITTTMLLGVCIGLPSFVILVSELCIVCLRRQNLVSASPAEQAPPLCCQSPAASTYFARCYRSLAAFVFGLIVVMSVHNICKYSIGRLRPHFLEVCKPDWKTFSCKDSQGFQQFIVGNVCTTQNFAELKEARLSFPSGHASISAFSMLFLVFYIQAMSPSWSYSFSHFLRPLVQGLLLAMAVVTGVSRISDHKHHWSDVLAGTSLGVLVAIGTVFCIADRFKPVSSGLCRDYYVSLFSLEKYPRHQLTEVPLTTKLGAQEY